MLYSEILATFKVSALLSENCCLASLRRITSAVPVDVQDCHSPSPPNSSLLLS